MLRSQRKTIIIVTALALAAGSSLALADNTATDMAGLFGLISKGLSLASGQNQLTTRFIKESANCVVITNKTSATWKFGYLDQTKSESNLKQSGTVTLKTVSFNLKSWTDLGSLAPGATSVPIPGAYGALVVKLTDGFFRVCYLEDANGDKVFLNVDNPNRLPRVGVAAASMKEVMRDRGGSLAPKLLEMFAPASIKEKKLQTVDMVAIGTDRVK
jgi:hypothetical protein